MSDVKNCISEIAISKQTEKIQA